MEKANWQNKWMGNMVMGKCEDWQESLTLFTQIVNILKENMEDYQWAMFTHAMDFFQEWASLKKLIPKHVFTSLLKDLSIEDLVTLGNLLLIEFMEPSKRLYATPGRRTRCRKI